MQSHWLTFLRSVRFKAPKENEATKSKTNAIGGAPEFQEYGQGTGPRRNLLISARTGIFSFLFNSVFHVFCTKNACIL